MGRGSAGVVLSEPRVVGLIADTHGLVRPSVRRALAGVDVILHAGDVGGADVLMELAAIAPVHAVGGNVDDLDTPNLPPTLEYRIGGVVIHVSHGHELGAPTSENVAARYASADVLVYGHTHRAAVARVGDRLIVNPGAAGAARFDLKPSVARLTIAGGRAEVEIVMLDDS